MKHIVFACIALLLVLVPSVVISQTASNDVLGVHDLGPGGPSPAKGPLSLGCGYCHVPHTGVGGHTPLWNQTLSSQSYATYSSQTYENKSAQPMLGSSSSLCLSCHDGTVAIGQTAAYGKITPMGTMAKNDAWGANMAGSHPFSMAPPLQDAPNLAQSLTTSHTTNDPTGKVRLVNNNVECNSCHNPHVQTTDMVSLNFLVINSANGQLCLACHDPNRVVEGKVNVLANWQTSVHATASNKTAAAANVGSYGTVAANACISCHQPHNAPGGGGLFRAPDPPLANVDPASQDCATCHNGGSNLSPGAPNIFAEYAKAGIGAGATLGTAHPWPAGTNTHTPNEDVLVTNNNRHAACVDCHNSHAASQTTSFNNPPTIRPSQSFVSGIAASDGITVVSPAVNQYDNCLRCHGSSTGKQASTTFGYQPLRVLVAGDPLSVIPQFNTGAVSSHPVMHNRTSPYTQFSLLSNMLQWDGTTQGRQMGSRIFCTDCHNSDDNREIGKDGPSGPHGSKYAHLLERRYEMAQAAAPGKTISNTFVNPDLTAGGANPGPYALCAKCHDLSTTVGVGVLSDASFKPSVKTGKGGHYTHIWDWGISCSACHTSHGNGASNANLLGQRLINFDGNVVAQNNGAPIAYNYDTNTCTLTCHNYNHNSDGSVTKVP